MAARRTGDSLATRLGCGVTALGSTDPTIARINAAGDDKQAVALAAHVIAESFPNPDGRVAYLLLGVISGRIPLPGLVVDVTRRWRQAGLQRTMEELTGLIPGTLARVMPSKSIRVRVVSDPCVLVTETAATPFTSGIQRVVRECIKRWPIENCEFIAWRSRAPHLHLTAITTHDEIVNVVGADLADVIEKRRATERGENIIPFDTVFIFPELDVDIEQLHRMTSVARYGATRSIAIGFDCIPVTTAEKTAVGMPGAFSHYLASLSAFDEVLPISEASSTEFRAWRGMLIGTGRPGPEITTVDLPYSAVSVDEKTRREEMASLTLSDGSPLDPDLPLLIAVGSHEPRKNHVNLLFAAELLWRQGIKFSLVMPGGNAWDAEMFITLRDRLQDAGRPLITIERAPDVLIWSLYASAKASYFCSFNEGFGLPVAESLSLGVPVVTSNFGSMKELAEGKGGILVDPRDPQGIAEALKTLIADDEQWQRLHQETKKLPQRSWDDYAAAIWAKTLIKD